MKHVLIGIILTFALIALSCQNKQKELTDDQLMEMAILICQNNLLIDSHIDWPEQLYSSPRDISEKNESGDFDIIRARQGGLNAALSVLYINSQENVDEGRLMLDSLYRIVTAYSTNYPNKFAGALTPADVKKNFQNNLFSTPLCLENGSIIGTELEYIGHLKDLGIVYITLCHDRSNQISDSNFDSNQPWEGLSPFGKDVVKEMNRLGLMIDISHSTDSAASQALRLSKAPVVATHSNCRYFVPGIERNLPDTLIKAIAAKDGVIMVNMGSFFLDSICSKNWAYLYYSSGQDMNSAEGIEFALEYGKTRELFSDSRMLVNHIDHIVELVGVDHVGIGSDYDGIGIAQPSDLPDVSSYPIVVAELLKRGYSEEEINKILSKNFLRVWNEVIDIGDSLNKGSTNS